MWLISSGEHGREVTMFSDLSWAVCCSQFLPPAGVLPGSRSCLVTSFIKSLSESSLNSSLVFSPPSRGPSELRWREV